MWDDKKIEIVGKGLYIEPARRVFEGVEPSNAPSAPPDGEGENEGHSVKQSNCECLKVPERD